MYSFPSIKLPFPFHYTMEFIINYIKKPFKCKSIVDTKKYIVGIPQPWLDLQRGMLYVLKHNWNDDGL